MTDIWKQKATVAKTIKRIESETANTTKTRFDMTNQHAEDHVTEITAEDPTNHPESAT